MMGLVAFLASRLKVRPVLIEIALGVLVFAAYTLYERQAGASSCERGNETRATKQEVHNEALQAQGTTTVYQEAQQYHEAIAAPVARPVALRVCPRASEVLPTASTAAGADAAVQPSGPSDAASVPGESTGPELQAVGRDGDAKIAGLQDYIRKVCLAR